MGQVSRVRDGKIVDARLYYDGMTFATQLGMVAGGPATATR
jgi:ketosteroid isomerase-like protein